MQQHGFKQISLANVLEFDDQPSHLFRRPNKEKWVQDCLEPKLESWVPVEIGFMYETVRGSMVYGMFFQPLASLAAEQCYRVLEAGARLRAENVGLARKQSDKVLPESSFIGILATLKEAGRISEKEYEGWLRIPFLRNSYSHPKLQRIQKSGEPVKTLAYTAQLLNRLFQ